MNNKVICCLLFSSLYVFSSDTDSTFSSNTGSVFSSVNDVVEVGVDSVQGSSNHFGQIFESTGECVEYQELDEAFYVPMKSLVWGMSHDTGLDIQYLLDGESFRRRRLENIENVAQEQLDKDIDQSVKTILVREYLENLSKLEKLQQLALQNKSSSPSPVSDEKMEQSICYRLQRQISSWPSYVAGGRFLFSPAQPRSSSHSPDFSGPESLDSSVLHGEEKLRKNLLSNCSFGSELDRNSEE